MLHEMSVMFLGTGSGGGPSVSRNCSSLVMDVVGDGSLWMVDCAEGTTRQLELQPYYDAQRYRRGRITNIFITHMHADHTMGLIGLLKNILAFPKPNSISSLKIQLFGPSGLRNFIRSILNMTESKTNDRYVVHELLKTDESSSAPCTPEALHPNEDSGLDVCCGEDGFWREFTRVEGSRGRPNIIVDAGPIAHRVPCIGYVMRESLPQGNDTDESTQSRLRKIVVLGDTNSPAAMIPLINSSPGHVALLVHEATDCFIPSDIDSDGITGRHRTPESVCNVSLQRGHSTPAMAGEFARAIAAQRLFLNHLGGRFPAPTYPVHGKQDNFRQSVMTEIENQATQAWAPQNSSARAVTTLDFTRVVIPPLARSTQLDSGTEVEMNMNVAGVGVTKPRILQPNSGGSGGAFYRNTGSNSAAAGSIGTRRLSTRAEPYSRSDNQRRRPRADKRGLPNEAVQ